MWDSVEEHQFITAIYGFLDATNRTFVFSNAGHNPPLLIKPNGDHRFVEYGDLPARMFKDNRYHQHFIRFETDQTMVLYTDGFTEIMNDAVKNTATNALPERVLAGIDLSAKEMIDFIRQGVSDFTERKFLDDDGTLFIV